MNCTTRFVLAVVLAFVACRAQASKIALVVGNSDYPVNAISTAAHDAQEVGSILASPGIDFEVDYCIDCNCVELRDAIARFRARLTPGGEAVFYYSGHGAQLGGDNFLLPTDIDAADFDGTAVPVKEVYDALKATPQAIGIVILDACRENLLLGNWPRKGLAAPQTNVYPAGTIIAFATWPDSDARKDHDGVHSPYTKALIEYMGQPGLSIHDFFMNVTKKVFVDYTDEHQLPWINTAEMVPFEFRPATHMRVRATADDDLIVTAGGEVYDYKMDASSKELRLEPGDNLVNIIATNYPSKAGAVREGWSYTLDLSSTDGQVSRTFHACEPHDGQPPKWRFGTSFLAARAIVNVDYRTGRMSFVSTEPSIWLDGFSLTGLTDDKARLDAALLWATAVRGVRLFDEEFPGAPIPLSQLRAGLVASHTAPDDSTTQDSACEPPDAHLSHDHAAALLEQATDDQLSQSVSRVRALQQASRISLEDGLHWAFGTDPNFHDAAEASLLSNDYKFVRFYYPYVQSDNPAVRERLAVLSNDELRTALQHALAQTTP